MIRTSIEDLVRQMPALIPFDEHNEQLLANVHPPEWKNPIPSGRYNLVVVGAGTAGLVSAAGAAGLGAKVALVERHLMGGDCLNVGCVPSKALIRCARAVASVREAAAFGIELPSEPRVDFAAIMERMRRLRSQISRHDSASRFTELGVDVFIGAARFTGKDSLEVADRKLRFKRAVIATGARPAAPRIPGLAETGFLTNETVFSLMNLPSRLAIIGGGPIGCELAQAFARFGARVSLIENALGILNREDRDAAQIIQAALERDGVEIMLGTKLIGVEKTGTEKVLSLERAGQTSTLVVDEIVLGVGRAPNVQGLGLEVAGVDYDAFNGVKVDDRLCTSNPAIFAAGDICLPYKFTHTADATARIAIQNALFGGRAKVSALAIPWCTYTDPEIAHVGMYVRDAEERGLSVERFFQKLDGIDRAVLDGEDEGFIKVHVKRGSDRILGATLVARHAGEMISELTLAIVAGAGLRTIARSIHPYPTQAEAIKKVGDAYNRTRLTPFVRGLFSRWLAWNR